jgi:hypothetical protein
MLTGSCFCKAVQYRITSAVPLAINCHCNSCKKAGGGAFSSLAVIREKRLEIISGEKSLTDFRLGEDVDKYFCRHCGTAIFNRNKRYPGRCMVAIGSLDNPESVPPTANIHCENMLDWVKLDENMQNFTQDYK